MEAPQSAAQPEQQRLEQQEADSRRFTALGKALGGSGGTPVIWVSLWYSPLHSTRTRMDVSPSEQVPAINITLLAIRASDYSTAFTLEMFPLRLSLPFYDPYPASPPYEFILLKR